MQALSWSGTQRNQSKLCMLRKKSLFLNDPERPLGELNSSIGSLEEDLNESSKLCISLQIRADPVDCQGGNCPRVMVPGYKNN